MSTRRKLAFLAGAIAVSTLAAWYRWPDSAHAIGVVKKGGGTARHPVALQAGQDSYVVIATAPVLPPWRGDAVVSVEGDPAPAWEVEVSRPILDLHLRRWPRQDGNRIRGLEPRDRLALWVKLTPPPADPVCGMACGKDTPRRALGGREECFCSDACWEAFRADPARHPPRRVERARWSLLLRDDRSGAPLLTVPIVLGGAEAGHDAPHH
jgi:YHS domain-containing protein